jgi:1-acyl-sn-glycerol-3-phosphate acyltransferase
MQESAPSSVYGPTRGSASRDAASAPAISTRRGWLQRLSRGWRIVGSGIAFASLGLASLLLAVLVLPVLRLFGGSRTRRQIRSQKTIHWFVRGYLRWLRILGVMRLESSGAERLREPGILVVANHPTLLDVLVLMSHMPQADCVVKQRYYDHFFLGGTARAAGYIPSRDGPGLVDDCVERLLQGRSLIIFPEGTRSPLRELGPFARGAAHIALRAGRDPVVATLRSEPPALHHGPAWWEIPERRFTLSVDVGEPLQIKTAVGQEPNRSRAARALTAAMRETIERQLFVGRS